MSATSLADTRSREFVVFVRVLPQCRLAMPSANSPGKVRLGISCTRNSGYSVNLTRDAATQNGTYTVSGIGTGAGQIISLGLPAAALRDTRVVQTATPLFLTVNY